LKVIEGWKSFEASFVFDKWKSIYAITGDYIFSKYYSDFKVTKPSTMSDDSYNFILTLDTGSCASKKERKELMAKVSTCIAEMRKNVMASPFLIAMENAAKGKLDAFKFGIKNEECIYVVPVGRH
jgi:Arp2/3 complex, 34 kD subunit p34-Arc